MLMMFQMLMVLWPQETACKEGPFALVQGARGGGSVPKQDQLRLPQMCNRHIVPSPTPTPLHFRDLRL